MAYKDEYEVGRLYTSPEFREQLESQFEGDYKLRIHLAPQFLPRDRETGRPRKYSFRPWVFLLFRVFAALKFLRGTPIDPTQLLAHRRFERRLIGEYESTVETLLAGLSRDNHDVAVEIARLPEHVRGFDDIKERSYQDVSAKQAERLTAALRADLKEVGFKRVEVGGPKNWWVRV